MADYQRVIVRTGLSSDVPALHAGELGYDTDTKTPRMGDGTDTPGQLLSTKGTVALDFSAVPEVTFSKINLAAGSLIAGADISTMVADTGIVVHQGAGTFDTVSLTSGDDTLVFSNESGVGGDIDVRLHPDVITTITGVTYLQQVSSSPSFTGTGKSGDPLTGVLATNTAMGMSFKANQSTVDNGTSDNSFVTPATLANITVGSVVANGLGAALAGSMAISSSSSFDGSGTTASPLVIKQSTETVLGAVTRAAQSDIDDGTDNTKYITANGLASATPGSALGTALANLVDTSSYTVDRTVFVTNGPIQSLSTDITRMHFSVSMEAIADLAADSFYECETVVELEMYINGSFQNVCTVSCKDTGGIPSLTTDRPRHDGQVNVFPWVFIDKQSTPNRVITMDNEISGTWDGQVRALLTLNGTGTKDTGATPVGNTGVATVSLAHSTR